MAGGFAHMTLVDTISPGKSEGANTLSDQIKGALGSYTNFLELGAVSPDYPYLTLFDQNAEGWANVMHYWHTMKVVRNAIPLICAMDNKSEDTKKCIAWLFGYLAHIVTDYTIHAVVFLKVGPYALNKMAHRDCELNQDVYIYNKIYGKKLDRDAYLEGAGIASCGPANNMGHLEPAVAQLWTKCLPPVPGTVFNLGDDLAHKPVAEPGVAPDPDKWHSNYVSMMDNVAHGSGYLPPLTRHLGVEAGIAYPALDKLDMTCIENLKTPEGVMHYDDVFRRTQEEVKSAWLQLDGALSTGQLACLTIPDGDLDTGCEKPKMITWKETI